MSNSIGDRIRELRQGRKLTQLVLSKRLGVSKALISAYENAMVYPPYDVLLGLADIFNVTTDYLLGKERVMSVSTKGLYPNQIELVSALVDEFQKANLNH